MGKEKRIKKHLSASRVISQSSVLGIAPETAATNANANGNVNDADIIQNADIQQQLQLQQNVPHLIASLRSGTPGQKENACQAIAHMAAYYHSTSSNRPSFASSEVIQLLSILVNDTTPIVAIAAAGALHNLVMIGENVAAALLNMNILSLLINVVNQHAKLDSNVLLTSTLTPPERSQHCTHILGCITTLIEYYDSALDIIQRNPLFISSLKNLFHPDHASLSLLVEISSFLLIATEENATITDIINRNPDYIQRLLYFCTTTDARVNDLVKVASATVLLNITSTDKLLAASLTPSSSTGGIFSILSTFATTLSKDLISVTTDFVEVLKNKKHQVNLEIGSIKKIIKKKPDKPQNPTSNMQTDNGMDTENIADDVEDENEDGNINENDSNMGQAPNASSAAGVGSSTSEPSLDAREAENKIQRVENAWRQFVDSAFDQWLAISTAQQRADESLTNMLTLFSSDDEDDANIEKTKRQALATISPLFTQSQIFENLLRHLNYSLPPETIASLRELLDFDDFRKCERAILAIRSRSADTLTNALLAFESIPFNTSQLTDISSLIRAAMSTVDASLNKVEGLQLIESLLGFVRQLLRLIDPNIALPTGFIHLIVDLLRAGPTSAIQIQAAGCLSTTMQNMKHFQTYHFVVATVLKEKVQSALDPNVSSEALNPAGLGKCIDGLNVAISCIDNLIDMYSGDDAIVMQSMRTIQLLDIFTRGYSHLQQKIDSLKRHREVRDILKSDWQPVIDNMEAFIGYMQNLPKS